MSGQQAEADLAGAGQVAVSVLMPLYNSAETLAHSVASVQAQTRGDWELLLTDDASTDDTAALAAALAATDPRIRLFRLQRNVGAAAARNHALSFARGRYIAFLDADDLWHPEKLARQIAFMQATGAGLSFTGYSRVSVEGRLIERVRPPAQVDHATLLRRNVMGCLTVIYDSARFGRVPMPDLRRQQDFALWLNLTRRFGPALGLDEDLAVYRVARTSLSGNKRLAALDTWRVLRRHERLPLHRALWFFAHYTCYGLRHRLVQRAAPDAPLLGPAAGRKQPRR